MQPTPQIHPLFCKFPNHSEPSDAGYQADFLGIRKRSEFLSGPAEEAMRVETVYPPINEEYFEWIDLLESVLAAKEKYTMMELGAGYGRWSVRAAFAVRLYRQIPFHLVAVEAEPRHFNWIGQHMRDNGIDPSEHTLLRVALSDRAGETLFYVGTPAGGDNQAAEWYGQALVQAYEVVHRPGEANYEGYDVVKLASGYEAIQTKCVLLDDIMPDTNRIDLVDMDLQGEELKVIASAIDILDRKVVRLHIGTHGPVIETGLRRLLAGHRWECRADYECLKENETPWGPVRFLDGLQSWVNPRLA